MLIGVLALAGAIGLGAYALMAGGGARVAVTRTVAAVERGYVVGNLPDRDSSFGQRVALPFARRLGGVGRALTPTGTRERLQRWLDRAGNPLGWTVDTVVMVKGVGLGYVALFLGFFGLLVGGFTGLAVCVVIGAVVGFYLPDLLVLNAGLRRQDQIRKSLADMLDMLTVSVEAGLGFDAALAQVARNARGPLAGETARALQEMQLGKSRVDALRDLAKRTTVIERTFASAVVQATELGIPIATVLREQAKEMRVRRRQRAEEKAQKVPVKILFPLIFLIFPSLFIIVLGPAVIRLMALMLSM
ncbi:MAG: type II secretion system F family protein [Micromonosporaceae bacterium]|nr:type II secretion system F family protein [Micromonosporaceae bacterium]